MIIGLIDSKLKERLRKKQHEVIQLRWEKAQLEKNLERMKKAQSERGTK